ncbi:acyl-CoA dehydrogenase family protein [Tomitella biformata]|uniref:acyl-CoA dehydrogenase family protein n=1 Tax=Tomitella biformata TaxID=630403 RepID=UPI0004638DC1|nr:acyl-CoA dehydrogenase family protein [Tomitella biformata]
MTATITDSIAQRRVSASEFVRERAAALDLGETDTRIDVSKLGELGLFGLGCQGGPVAEMVAVIEDVAAESLSAGFSAWAHRMALEYVVRGPAAVQAKYQAKLESGAAVGVTAMAAGLKYVAGLGEVALVATEVDGGGLQISGPIHWASNVFDDALIVLCARSADSTKTYVAIIEASAPGITVRPASQLLALNSTASTSLVLDAVHIPAENIIGTDLTEFVKGVRPTFLLLQTAFCSGISRTSVEESAKCLGGLGEGFVDEHAELAVELAALRDRLGRFAADTTSASARELIQLRLDGSRLAMAATRLEVTLKGGAGYSMKSPTNRRFREAAFLPVQSPSEGQLRWELARSS